MKPAPFAIASVLLATVVLAGQQAPPQTPPAATFRSGTLSVPIYATVVDKTGRLVPDLEESHFQVFDNLKPQTITVFKSDVQPITIVVMLDTSGSMTLNLDFLKIAAEQFVLRLLPEDRARIGSFSDKIKISPRFTGNRDELVSVLRNDIQFGNPTHLWDAINRSMTELSTETGRRVVLVFTDGADDRSREVDFDDVLARAQAEDFMIYAIGLQAEFLGRIVRPDRNLRKLAEDTGGGYFELKKTADLNATFTRVADELHRQYVLGFSPQTLDGLVHKLEVRVKLPDMTARARKTYVASRIPQLPSLPAPTVPGGLAPRH